MEYFTKLRVVQDVTIEGDSMNMNDLEYLIVGLHPNYPLKRSLLRFEPLNVPYCDVVKRADLYLYYVYAHKASFMPSAQVPSLPRTIVAHQVLKEWDESEATSTKRINTVYWDSPRLNLGTDAMASPTSSGITIAPGISPADFYAIDVTSAVRNWKNGQPNFGLLIRATNEFQPGRDLRFASNAKPSQSDRHAYIMVTCESHSSGGNDGGVGAGVAPGVVVPVDPVILPV